GHARAPRGAVAEGEAVVHELVRHVHHQERGLLSKAPSAPPLFARRRQILGGDNSFPDAHRAFSSHYEPGSPDKPGCSGASGPGPSSRSRRVTATLSSNSWGLS